MVNKANFPKLFFLGPIGSFHSIVSNNYDKTKKYDHIEVSNFEEIFERVLWDLGSIGIVAYTNHLAGDIKEVHDLLTIYSIKNIKILGYIQLPICLSLLAKINHSKKSLVYSQVYSHPKALEQCSEYIAKNNLEKVESLSTSLAGKIVSESDCNTDCCIGDESLTTIYGLQIIQKNIANSLTNFTTFAVITKLS